MRAYAVVLLLVLASCGGRVTESRSFVDSDAAAFWKPGESENRVPVQGVPSWGFVASGALSGANTTGTVAIYEKDGRRELVLEGFRGPPGRVYLTRDGSLERAIDLGATGQSSYPVPGSASMEEYRLVIVSSDYGIAQAPLG